ncbi:MAG: phosphoglycolate phosphatase [Gammaproteobacteria bacterium]|nr:phosphoglycolate phosphatase [Gammaproteobacteria bacterium]
MAAETDSQGRTCATRAPLAGKRAVLLDLDGTLIDSVADLAFCANAMLRDLDPTAPRGIAVERCRQFVGNGVERFVHRCLTDQQHGDAEPALFRRALARFDALYRQHNGRHATIYPHVQTTLAQLRERELRLACITNKPQRFTIELLQRAGLARYFDVVVSGDTLPRRKPDPAPLRHALSLLDLSAQDAVMVGDSVTDLEAASAAEIDCVCVSYGYNHGQPIRDSRPAYLIDAMSELLPLLGLEDGG